jgi:CubicO group peptidase (beta-lactamase class C family)
MCDPFRRSALVAVMVVVTVLAAACDGGSRGPMPVPTRWPSGGLLGSAVDLVRLGGLILPKATFLPAAVVATMLEPQQTRSGVSAGVGLGWRIGVDAAGRRIAQHAGNLPDARAVVVVNVELGVVVALMSNRGGAPADVEGAAGQLVAPFLAVAAPPRS